MSTKRTLDWERIETDYRKGIMSLREIAGEHALTEGAIRKRAKADGWSRDLKAKINAKADELVRKAEYAGSTQARTSERETVDIAAQAIASIKLAHRTDIKKLRDLLTKMVGELELSDEELKTRITCAKAASDTLKNLVTLEAEAWGFANIPDTPPPLDELDPMEGARRLAFALVRADKMTQPTVH